MTYNVFGGTLNLTQSINQSMSGDKSDARVGHYSAIGHCSR